MPEPEPQRPNLQEETTDVLLKIMQALGDSEGLADLIAVVQRELGRLIDTRNFFLALYDESSGTYSFPFFADEFDDLRELGPQQLARSLTDYVRRTGRAWLVDGELHKELVRQGEVAMIGTPSPIWLGVPLQGSDRVLGVLAVQSYYRDTLYTQSDLQVLNSISRHIALAIERKQAQDALSESEQRMRSFQAACTDGIVFHDGRAILDANEAMTRISGYELSELVGTSPLQLAVPEDRLRAAVAVRGTGEHEFEVAGVRKDGSTLPIVVHSRDVPYRGLPARVAIVRDITDRQNATKALQESEQRYRGLFESSQEAIFISSVDGTIEDVNPAAIELFGCSSKEEVLAPGLVTELYEDPRDRVRLFKILSEQGKVRDYELRLKTKQGKPLIVLETSEALKNAAGEVVGYRGWLRDVTEARALERQLLQAQKMEAVGRLAGGIAHDFNNLLLIINGYAELLSKDLLPGDPARSDLEAIGEAGLRAADLVQQLLAFSRQQVLKPRVVDFNEVVERFKELISRAVGDRVTVRLSLASSACLVKADVGQLEQVLMNLAVNARDAMPDGGELVLETRHAELETGRIIGQVHIEAGRYSVVAVRDTGMGIDAGDVDRLFEPFFTTKAMGTGLGLSTVYGIVKQSGGYILVDSKRGIGTVFTIYLPRVDQGPDRENDQVVETVAIDSSATVLVVDDNPGVCSFAEKALRGYGFHVLTATDGEEALHICRESARGIDVLLTDRRMPGMNGSALATLAKGLRPRMKVAYMTGHLVEDQSQQPSGENGVPILRKPFSARQVAETVWRVIQ